MLNLEKEKVSFLSKISDSTKIKIIRWWCAAAIYFFIGWGTTLGGNETPYDLVVALGIVAGLANVFVVHPVIYAMFDIERKGKIENKKYYERTVLEGVWHKLGEVFKCLLVSIMVFFIYQIINISIINIFNGDESSVVFGGYPITYGIFFLGCYLLCDGIANKIKDLIERKKN